jgi:hypothetical protein
MKLTPENIAEAADMYFGEGWSHFEPAPAPGETEFTRNLKAMGAECCSYCKSWWSCDEVLGDDEFDGDVYCIECAENFASDGNFNSREHMAFSAILSELQDRVTCRTIEEARADLAEFNARVAEHQRVFAA